MAMSNGSYSAQLESHEDRLQRVESSLQEVVAETATVSVKIDFLSQQQTVQGRQILERLAELASTLDLDIAKVNETLKSQGTKIETLTSQEARRTSRWGVFKAISAPLFLALGGVIATGLGGVLWRWLSR